MFHQMQIYLNNSNYVIYSNNLKKKLVGYYNLDEFTQQMKIITISIDMVFYNESSLFRNILNLNFPSPFRETFLLGINIKKIKVAFKLLNLSISYYLYKKLYLRIKKFIFPIDDFNLFEIFLINNNNIFEHNLIQLIKKLDNINNKNIIIQILLASYDNILDINIDSKTVENFIGIIKDIFELVFDINLNLIRIYNN